jgi:hypothetical protein
MPLRGQVFVFLQAEADEPGSSGDGVPETAFDPADEVLALRDARAVGELRDGGVEVLVVQRLHHPGGDQGVQGPQVDHEAGGLVHLSLDGHEEPVIVAVAREVGALAEAGAVLLLAPLGTTVEMAGAEAVAPFETDVHGGLPI